MQSRSDIFDLDNCVNDQGLYDPNYSYIIAFNVDIYISLKAKGQLRTCILYCGLWDLKHSFLSNSITKKSNDLFRP